MGYLSWIWDSTLIWEILILTISAELGINSKDTQEEPAGISVTDYSTYTTGAITSTVISNATTLSQENSWNSTFGVIYDD